MLKQLQNVCAQPVFDDFPGFDAKEVHTRILDDRIMAFNRNYPGYLALELGSTISSSLALALADLQQGIQARFDALLAAYWPHSTPEQRHLPLLVSYRLFLALLPLALQGDEEHQHAIVREMKVVLYRYWEPIIGMRRASEVFSHETHAAEGEREREERTRSF